MKTNTKKHLSICAAALAAALSLTCMGHMTTPTATAAEASTNLTDATLQQYADDVVALVNQERAAEGLSPLYAVPLINGAAAIRAEECAESFSHTRPDGTSCGTILDEYGITWYYRGENIAFGYVEATEVMGGWMNSPGHRSNIMDPDFQYIGVGTAVVDGVLYWAQIFVGETDTTEGAYLPALSTMETVQAPAQTMAPVQTEVQAQVQTQIHETTTTVAQTTASAQEITDAAPVDAHMTLGDINLDGVVNLVDVVLLNKYCSGSLVLGERALNNADCASDDGVDTNDSLVLLQFLLRIVQTLPCES